MQLPLFVILLSVLKYCLNESPPDTVGSAIVSDMLLNESNARTLDEGCILALSSDNGSTFDRAYCTTASVLNCRYRTVVDIKDNTELDERKDDLLFIQVNITECGSAVSALSTIYSDISPAASMLLDRLIDEANISNSNRVFLSTVHSCSESNLLSLDRLRDMQGVELDLALLPETTDACLDNLNITGESRVLLDRIRAGQLKLAQPCSIDNQTSVTC